MSTRLAARFPVNSRFVEDFIIYLCLCSIFSQEYKLAGDCFGGETDAAFKGEHGGSNFLLILRFESTKIRSEKEVWAYRTLSFLADQGGSISLFVGVSLLSVWDSAEYFLTRFYYKARSHTNQFTP